MFEAATEGEHELLVEFPLPDQAIEYVRDWFEEAGIDQQYVITLIAESAETDRFADLEERFMPGTEERDSISPAELRTTVLSLHLDPLPNYLLTVISALVAVAGLLVDSAALVVRAMVIAPQVSSALDSANTPGSSTLAPDSVSRPAILSVTGAYRGRTRGGPGAAPWPDPAFTEWSV